MPIFNLYRSDLLQSCQNKIIYNWNLLSSVADEYFTSLLAYMETSLGRNLMLLDISDFENFTVFPFVSVANKCYWLEKVFILELCFKCKKSVLMIGKFTIIPDKLEFCLSIQEFTFDIFYFVIFLCLFSIINRIKTQ